MPAVPVPDELQTTKPPGVSSLPVFVPVISVPPEVIVNSSESVPLAVKVPG